ncbi:DUF1801 domain-containing protein [Vibrio mediterranei]|uniref:DUF1801 domain-containing protein n=1 Tax=Vibrio barjaei TaxID=1676683 RepID=UPI0007BB89BE|nr:DUF1801 domain-containing protein [Vibrio barjaei]MCG9787073.1 DUF1801 domain-containing protein [Vibrio mediterranei]OIN25762.1 hypothetical protein AWH66_2015930 [Vibrio barjaei]
MSTLKSRPTAEDPCVFIELVKNEQRRRDAETLLTMFTNVTVRQPVMWGESIIGFGEYRYTNTRGTYSWMMTGFSPQKQNLTLYIMQGYDNLQHELEKHGQFRTAKSSLYINNLSKVHLKDLELLLVKAVAEMESKYPCT